MNSKKSTSLYNIDDQLSALWQQPAARDLGFGQGSRTTISTFPYPRKIPQRNFDLLAFVRWLGDQIWEFPEQRQFPGDPIQDSPPSSSIQRSSNIAMFSENLITHCDKQQNSPVTESHKIFKCRTFFTQFVHRKTNKSGEGLPAK